MLVESYYDHECQLHTLPANVLLIIVHTPTPQKVNFEGVQQILSLLALLNIGYTLKYRVSI